MSAASLIDTHWVPPALPELKLVERNGFWLCLNPAVPAWFGTTETGALMLQMVDGRRSIEEWQTLLEENDVNMPLARLTEFFQSVVDARLFDRPTKNPTTWEDRKLHSIYLHLTNRCNLQCSYCYRESSPQLSVLHDSRRFSEMLEYVKPFTALKMEITFSGGEPLMHPGFKDIVATSSDLGYTNILLTNGTLITDEIASFVKEHFKFAKISLDGPDEETHSKTRGKGNFKNVIRGIRRLADCGVRVKVQVTLTRNGLQNIDRLKEVLPDVPLVTTMYTPLLPMGRGASMDDESVTNETFYDLAKKMPMGVNYVPGRQVRSCHAGLGNLSIADTGDVYPCHHFHAHDFHFGNIFHDPFEEIFYGETVRRFVRSMDVEENNPTCKACELRFLCAGGCHANNLHATGSHRGTDIFCSYMKMRIYDRLFELARRDAGKRASAAQ